MAEQMITTASSLVQSLVLRNSEPDWLKAIREGAWKTYTELPSPKLEKTDLTKREWVVTELAKVPSDEEPREEVARLLKAAADQPVIYLRDGTVKEIRVPEKLIKQGVVVTDLQSAVSNQGDLVRKYLTSVVAKDESKWAALNAALWENGVFVYVPKQVQVEEPVQFIYEETALGGGARPRALVVADIGSSVTFAEISFVPEAGAKGAVHSAVTEIVALADAHVEACAFTNFRKGPTNFVVRRAKVDKDASVNWVAGDIGDGFTVALVESRLEGSGSQSLSRLLGFGYGRQRLELTASVNHFGRSSESDIIMHGVMRGRANSVYRSSTHIQRGAVDAASEQHDRMLVLDSSTRADAIPMLLIDENDVRRCGHAASVGKIDEDQVYYLMSRGIPKAQATKMIVWSYLAPTVDLIPAEGFREFVSARIDKELGE